jgi:hypothetical protein
MDFAKLRAPFNPDRVSWRVGSTNKEKTKGMALAYVDARDVMDRLDEVCGPAGWQCSYPHANGKTVCAIGIKVGDEWIWKSDGAGDSDIEAEKGALSDAFKRAAVRWAIGRYLYDVDSPWVEIESFGKSHKIKEGEYRRLRRLLAGGAPEVARPAEPLPDKPVDGRTKLPPLAPKAPEAKPAFVSRPVGGWSPAAANVFGKQFLEIAKRLPTGALRQEHYKMNEALIEEIRVLSAPAAEYINNKFAELQ